MNAAALGRGVHILGNRDYRPVETDAPQKTVKIAMGCIAQPVPPVVI